LVAVELGNLEVLRGLYDEVSGKLQGDPGAVAFRYGRDGNVSRDTRDASILFSSVCSASVIVAW
jgi:uncharacterized protein (DUF2461 family)